jgi:hypothetical protein
MIGLQNAKKAAEVSLGGPSVELIIQFWLGTPPGRRLFDAAGHMFAAIGKLQSPTCVVAAE